jgi:tetratricopeptide (TPR) repeat protein
MMKKTAALIIILFLVAVVASAQEYQGKGRISGIVLDAQGKPVEGVKVKLFYVKDAQGFDVLTDAKGEWKASWMRGGPWNIDFEKTGCTPKKISFNLNEYGRNPPIEVKLEKMEGLAISEDLKKELAAGNCYANRGQNDKALEWYAKVELDKIDDPVILYNIGTNYYNNSKFEDALKFYKKAVELKPDFTDAIYQLGLTYLTMGHNPEVIASFESCLKHDADSQRAGQVKSFLETLKKK